MKQEWEAAVKESRGDPKDKAVVVEHWAMAATDEEAREGALKWRFIAKAWEHGFFDNVSPAEIQARAEREIALEEVLAGWTVSLDPKEHLDALKELAHHGATHVVIHSAAENQLKTIDFYSKQVLPALRKGI